MWPPIIAFAVITMAICIGAAWWFCHALGKGTDRQIEAVNTQAQEGIANVQQSINTLRNEVSDAFKGMRQEVIATVGSAMSNAVTENRREIAQLRDQINSSALELTIPTQATAKPAPVATKPVKKPKPVATQQIQVQEDLNLAMTQPERVVERVIVVTQQVVTVMEPQQPQVVVRYIQAPEPVVVTPPPPPPPQAVVYYPPPPPPPQVYAAPPPPRCDFGGIGIRVVIPLFGGHGGGHHR
jgi:hypothetical protein